METTRITFRDNHQWREERSRSIGASSVPAILGLSPFASPNDIAKRMRDELNGKFDYSQSFAMLRGHAYESGIAYLFHHFSGHDIIEKSAAEYIVRRTDIPFMHASPDRIFWKKNDGPRHGKVSEINKGVLECKTTRRSINANQPPLEWIIQLQVQMGITGYHTGALAWDQLHKANDAFGFKYFFFNEELFVLVVEICQEFWNDAILSGKRHKADYLGIMKLRFPYLFENRHEKRPCIFSRLIHNKEIPSCISSNPVAKQPCSTMEPQQSLKETIFHPVAEERLCLPEPDDDDDDKSSWILKILNRK